MKQRGANVFRSLDWIILLIYSALLFMGWFNIHAACYDDTHESIFDFSMRYGKQLVWIGVSYVIVILIMASNFRLYSVLSYFIYGFMILLLIAVLVVGTKTNGARSWFEIGPLKIQPAEFAKFATALALSKIMSAYNFDIKKIPNLFMAVGILLLPAALILLQPDMGSVLVYASMIFVFFREGLWSIIMWLIALGVVIFVTTLQYPLVFVMLGLVIVAGIWLLAFGRPIVEILIAWGAVAVLTALLWVINHYLMHERFEWHYLIVGASLILLPGVVVFSYIQRKWSPTFIWLGLIACFAVVFSVDFVFNNGLMNGMTETTFAPNEAMSRAMLVTVLWRAEGSPAPAGTTPFTDLKAKWYKDAVAWAYENEIVKGMTATTFDPNAPLSREQIAAIMYRYSEYRGADVSGRASLDGFPDGAKTHNYAKDAMSWAVYEGLISGTKAGDKVLLDPRGNATRAQVATILMRYLEG